MRKFRVKEDCFCEGYLHELINYPREGLVEKKLLEDDIVVMVQDWTNFYGSYYRVKKGEEFYDILPEKLQELNEDELYFVELPYATFGIICEDNKITKTAPMGKWMVGKTVYDIGKWVKNKKGTITRVK